MKRSEETRAIPRLQQERDPAENEPLRLPRLALKARGGWLRCPLCGKKLFPMRDGTHVAKLAVKCRGCGEEYDADFPRLQ